MYLTNNLGWDWQFIESMPTLKICFIPPPRIVGSLEDGSPQQGLKAQVRQAFENLNTILAEANCSFDDVVDVTVFMVDAPATFEEVWSVVPEYWGVAPYPTLTAVGVTWLYGYDFEIKVIAKLPDA